MSTFAFLKCESLRWFIFFFSVLLAISAVALAGRSCSSSDDRNKNRKSPKKSENARKVIAQTKTLVTTLVEGNKPEQGEIMLYLLKFGRNIMCSYWKNLKCFGV